MKFGTQTNSIIQNSMMMFIFSLFDEENLFWANLLKKSQNFQFKLKFYTQTNSNIQNSMVQCTSFRPKMLFLRRFDPENQNCQKFGA